MTVNKQSKHTLLCSAHSQSPNKWLLFEKSKNKIVAKQGSFECQSGLAGKEENIDTTRLQQTDDAAVQTPTFGATSRMFPHAALGSPKRPLQVRGLFIKAEAISGREKVALAVRKIDYFHHLSQKSCLPASTPSSIFISALTTIYSPYNWGWNLPHCNGALNNSLLKEHALPSVGDMRVCVSIKQINSCLTFFFPLKAALKRLRVRGWGGGKRSRRKQH